MAFLKCRFSEPLFVVLVECVKMAAKSLTVGFSVITANLSVVW